MAFTPDQVRNAVKEHNTVFFNDKLEPVVPVAGDWFCEFHIQPVYGGGEQVRDEAFVEFIEGQDVQAGKPFTAVAEEDGDVRRPRGDILIRQNY